MWKKIAKIFLYALHIDLTRKVLTICKIGLRYMLIEEITPRPKQDVKRQKKEGVMYEILHSWNNLKR